MRILAVLTVLTMVAACGDSKLTDAEIHRSVICADDWYDGARQATPRNDGMPRCDAVCESTAEFFSSGCEVPEEALADTGAIACPADGPGGEVGYETVLTDGTHGCCYPIDPGTGGFSRVRFYPCQSN